MYLHNCIDWKASQLLHAHLPLCASRKKKCLYLKHVCRATFRVCRLQNRNNLRGTSTQMRGPNGHQRGLESSGVWGGLRHTVSYLRVKAPFKWEVKILHHVVSAFRSGILWWKRSCNFNLKRHVGSNSVTQLKSDDDETPSKVWGPQMTTWIGPKCCKFNF